MSTPVNSSLNVQSCNVHPYELISHCPMLQWLPPVNSPLIVQCCNDYPLWSHLSMFSPAMSTPVNSSFNAQSCNVHPREFIFQCSVLQCPPLWTHLSMSSPAMSTPVNSSLNVQSCNVHSCEFISQRPVLQCPLLWIHLSMSNPAMSTPVNSSLNVQFCNVRTCEFNTQSCNFSSLNRCYFPQESGRGWTKDEANGSLCLVGFSAQSFLHSFHAADCMARSPSDQWTSGQTNLITGRVAAAHGRFNGSDGVSVHPTLIHASLDPPESKSQTASQSVPQFLQSSLQSGWLYLFA